MIKGNIKGKRTNSFTGYVKDVQLAYTIEISHNEYSEGKFILQLIGGPTGYEGFIIDDDMKNLEEMAEKGWTACMGTKERWDKLVIEADEMQKILNAFNSSDKVCPHCNYVNMMHDKVCHGCNKDIVDDEGVTLIPERKENANSS